MTGMTVGDLVEALRRFPQDLKVAVYAAHEGFDLLTPGCIEARANPEPWLPGEYLTLIGDADAPMQAHEVT
jgi:hypothetical protein